MCGSTIVVSFVIYDTLRCCCINVLPKMVRRPAVQVHSNSFTFPFLSYYFYCWRYNMPVLPYVCSQQPYGFHYVKKLHLRHSSLFSIWFMSLFPPFLIPITPFHSICLHLFVGFARFHLRALAFNIYIPLLPKLVLFFLLISYSSNISTFTAPNTVYLLRYLNDVLTLLLHSLAHVSYIFHYARHVNKRLIHAPVNECKLSIFVRFHQLTFGIHLCVPDMYVNTFHSLLLQRRSWFLFHGHDGVQSCFSGRILPHDAVFEHDVFQSLCTSICCFLFFLLSRSSRLVSFLSLSFIPIRVWLLGFL